MSKSTINFGIDLGTSNSLIAKFDKGEITVFKNPSGFKESLPSVVGFRNDRILIGEQAKAYLQRDSRSVVSRFKRKMGTSESFQIRALSASRSLRLIALVSTKRSMPARRASGKACNSPRHERSA